MVCKNPVWKKDECLEKMGKTHGTESSQLGSTEMMEKHRYERSTKV